MSASNSDPYNPFDPTGMFKDMRDASMGTWAKMMVDVVNTEAYAEASGAMLDAWLASSGPFRDAIQRSMTSTLTNMNIPTREDVTRLAGRITNIEMRLDDLDAKLDELISIVRNSCDTESN